MFQKKIKLQPELSWHCLMFCMWLYFENGDDLLYNLRTFFKVDGSSDWCFCPSDDHLMRPRQFCPAWFCMWDMVRPGVLSTDKDSYLAFLRRKIQTHLFPSHDANNTWGSLTALPVLMKVVEILKSSKYFIFALIFHKNATKVFFIYFKKTLI